MDAWAIAIKDGYSDYGLSIRAAIRGLWSGAVDIFDYADSMINTIRRGLNRAWREGARQAGVAANELTPQETQTIDAIINEEFKHILPLGREIVAGNKASGGLLRPFLDRSEMWTLRYRDVQNQAKTSAATDPKLEWVWNPAKEHCRSCAALNGKVKRASYWRELGITPQSPPNDKLECGGWKCGCGFVVTDKPVSRGPLPRLP